MTIKAGADQVKTRNACGALSVNIYWCEILSTISVINFNWVQNYLNTHRWWSMWRTYILMIHDTPKSVDRAHHAGSSQKLASRLETGQKFGW